jgi:hypothetical protein
LSRRPWLHHHHAAIKKFSSYREHHSLARNALLTIYKNFSDETLYKVLALALLLRHGGVLLGEADPSVLDLQRRRAATAIERRRLTSWFDRLYAVDYLARELPELTEQRRGVQASRIRSDEAMAPLFGDLLQGTSPATGYHRAWVNTIKAFGLDDGVLRRRRVAVITADTVSKRMAGPAIRAFHIADTLNHHSTSFISTTKCTLDNERFECVYAVLMRCVRLSSGRTSSCFKGSCCTRHLGSGIPTRSSSLISMTRCTSNSLSRAGRTILAGVP